mgnify:CR=1 FL=1
MSVGSDGKPDQSVRQQPGIRFSASRLVVIPLLVYGIWVLETFLLERSLGLFAHYQPLPLVM